MSKLSTRTRKCHFVNVGGAAFLPHNRKIGHRHTGSGRLCSKNAAPPIPVGVRPPPPLRGSSPCEAGQCHLSMEGCAQGRISFRSGIRIMSSCRGNIVITADFGDFAEIQKQFLNGRGCPVRSSKLLCLAFFRCASQLLFHVFHGAEGNDDVKCRVDDAVNLFFVIVFSSETRLVGEIHAVGVDCPT